VSLETVYPGDSAPMYSVDMMTFVRLFICDFNSNSVLELHYFDRLYSARSLYWIIMFIFKIEIECY